MKKQKALLAVLTLMLASKAVFAFSSGFEGTNPEAIMHFIQGNNPVVYLAVFFGLGILLAFTPCVLPMIPILSGIIVGQHNLSTAKSVKLSLSYVFGMAITYAMAGMVAGLMGSTLQTLMQRPAVIIAFSLLFVLMALSMFGLFELRVPAKMNARLSNFSQKTNKHTFISVALMGVISTLVVSPCVTAPLIGVLTYIGQNGQVFMGGLILFIMALGMGVPLLAVGAGYGSFLPKSGPWMEKIKQLFGVIMFAMAIWILGRVLPENVSKLLWAGLLIISGFILGRFRLQSQSHWFARLVQGVAFAGLIAGSSMAYLTVTKVIYPAMNEKNAAHAPFIEVDSLHAIKKKLATAKKEHQAVYVEFYATWCSDCQAMETKVFNQPEVVKAMTGLINLKVNLSDSSSEEVRNIKKAFSIYGMPTMLFFNKKGEHLTHLNAVGSINQQELTALLKQIKT
ncbi:MULTISPECIES: protein-disulfide reductase DsbD [unclassified Legionella]|uniref:protein-disulfide reductase DsbD n=1 Tax=unclassified Legionella TaxID=2622702 RepID=UPI0010568D23|nr:MULTISPECIES: protein-disulfide reductase DsbD [unclassified Legionella]MDI9817892.1 protein-disulfide reductase DsbD [Legionella sp. PL877]